MAFQPEARSSVSWPGYIWIIIVLGAFAAAGAIGYSVGWRMADRPLLGIGLIILFGAPIVAWVWTRRTGDKLLWMLSTKMMPPAGALIPIYLIFNRNGLIFKDWCWIDLSDYNLIDTFAGMIPLMMLLNLPIVIWMLYTYFKEIPFGILEAARMDGANLWQELANVLAPGNNEAAGALQAFPGTFGSLLWLLRQRRRFRNVTSPGHTVLQVSLAIAAAAQAFSERKRSDGLAA